MTTSARPGSNHVTAGPALSDIGAMARRDGRWWVFPSGYRCPVVAGGSGGHGQAGNAGGEAQVDPPAGGGSGGGNPPPAGDPAAGGSGPAGQGAPPANAGAGGGGSGRRGAAGTGLTQADVDKAAREAKKAATAELAAALGCSIDEAKTIIAERKAAQDAEKTEAQRAREAADAEKASAAEEKRLAALDRKALRTERALLAAKVNDKRLEKAARLILAELADDADEAAVTAAVEAFKKDTPEWFTPAGTAPGYDPAGNPGAGGGNEGKTGMEKGRLRAQEELKSRANAGSPFDGMTVVGGRPPGGNSQ